MAGYEVLSDTTLGADATTLNLASLDLSEWYKVRVVVPKIRTVGQGGGGGDWDRTFYRFNDDGAANKYIWGVRNYNSSNVTNDSPGYINGIEAGHMPGPNIGASYWGGNILDIYNPGRNDIYKTVQLVNAHLRMTGVSLATWGPAIWKDLAPITKITLHPNVIAESIKAGSRAFLLGMIPADTPTSKAPDVLPAVSVSDDFNRANGALGGGWTAGTDGGGGTPATILNNEYCGHGTGVVSRWTANNPFPSDQYSEVVVGTQGLPLAASKWTGPMVRTRANYTQGYLCIYFNNGGTHELRLYSKDGGYTQLGSTYAIGRACIAGDVVRIEAQGTTIRVKFNGATVITVTNTDWSYGNPGIGSITDGTELTLNAWAGGTL